MAYSAPGDRPDRGCLTVLSLRSEHFAHHGHKLPDLIRGVSVKTRSMHRCESPWFVIRKLFQYSPGVMRVWHIVREWARLTPQQCVSRALDDAVVGQRLTVAP